MPRSFALSLDAPVAVDEILAAFADEDYWRARLAAFDGGTATLNGLTVDPGGSVTAALTVSLLSNRLPKVVAALAPGDLEMARTETWHRGLRRPCLRPDRGVGSRRTGVGHRQR